MKKKKRNGLGKMIALLLVLDLLAYLFFFGLPLFFNVDDLLTANMLMDGIYGLEVLLWVLCILDGGRIFLQREIRGYTVLVGISEVVLAIFLTPLVFTLWQGVPGNGLLFFDLFGEGAFARFWGLARMTSMYVLLLKGIGTFWLKPQEPDALKMEDIIKTDGGINEQ